MNLKLVPLLLCATGMAFAQATSPDLKNPENLKPQADAPPMLGIHWSRDFEPNARAAEEARTPARSRRSPDMTYHGGVIMPTANTAAIFWGTSWATYSGDKITGMDSWYQGFSNSDYAKASDEYTGSNGQVGPATNYTGHIK